MIDINIDGKLSKAVKIRYRRQVGHLHVVEHHGVDCIKEVDADGVDDLLGCGKRSVVVPLIGQRIVFVREAHVAVLRGYPFASAFLVNCTSNRKRHEHCHHSRRDQKCS